jgi:DNA-directed RNA polymerase specialized sigma24 family protein
MIVEEGDLSALEELCGKAVDLLLARREWQLLDRKEFGRRACDYLRDGIASNALRAAIYVYSQALHAACSGAEGPARQNRAYTELFHYLYDSALSRYPDICGEVAQRATTGVFFNFVRCRQPGTFLAFALQRLLDAARAVRHEQAHGLAAGAVGPLYGLIPDAHQPDPGDAAIAAEFHARLAQIADEFLQKHPRAGKQFAALRLKFIDGLDDYTISQLLKTPVKNVYVLRSRAIEKLRAEPSWRALAAEFGILPDQRPPAHGG